MRRDRAAVTLTDERLSGFSFLLAAMLAELTLAPFIVMATGHLGLVMVRMLGVIVLLAALSVTGTHGAAVVLFIAALVSYLAEIISGSQSAAVAAETFRLVFLCYVVGLVVRPVLRDRTITLDTVAGAACVYFLLGLIWADLFFVFERWRPGSFHVPATWTIGSDRDLRSALGYFSFATLTTLGYGDIHPNDPAAGSLCDAEAMVGQLYLAIMIARLVGLQTSQRAS